VWDLDRAVWMREDPGLGGRFLTAFITMELPSLFFKRVRNTKSVSCVYHEPYDWGPLSPSMPYHTRLLPWGAK